MSSSRRRPFIRFLSAGLLAVAAAGVAGCTVQPLYGSAGGGSAIGTPSDSLPAISIEPVNTREAQEVRNHLIFLLNGGAGEPANPAYRLKLGISKRAVASATVQPVTSTGREPTAGRVVMTSAYVLTDAATGQVIAEGKRQTFASFDQPKQEFAVARAEIDAENRAARELAEILRLTVAQELIAKAR